MAMFLLTNSLSHSILYHSQVAFQLSSSGHVPALVTPEQVGTQVLKYLLDITAEYLGHDQVITNEHCVTCVVFRAFKVSVD